MPEPEQCPHCGVSLIGSPIPEDIQADLGGHTHARRAILVKHHAAGDDVMYLQCPDCDGRWHYYSAETAVMAYLRAKAEPYVAGLRDPDDDHR